MECTVLQVTGRIRDLGPTPCLDPIQRADCVSQSSTGVLDSSLVLPFRIRPSSKAQVDPRRIQANLPLHKLWVDSSFCNLPEFGGSAVSPNLCSSLVLYVHAIIQVDLHCSPASSNINHQLPWLIPDFLASFMDLSTCNSCLKGFLSVTQVDCQCFSIQPKQHTSLQSVIVWESTFLSYYAVQLSTQWKVWIIGIRAQTH
jgi:hypothetical protein